MAAHRKEGKFLYEANREMAEDTADPWDPSLNEQLDSSPSASTTRGRYQCTVRRESDVDQCDEPGAIDGEKRFTQLSRDQPSVTSPGPGAGSHKDAAPAGGGLQRPNPRLHISGKSAGQSSSLWRGTGKPAESSGTGVRQLPTPYR